jgi:hypothetical protein
MLHSNDAVMNAAGQNLCVITESKLIKQSQCVQLQVLHGNCCCMAVSVAGQAQDKLHNAALAWG